MKIAGSLLSLLGLVLAEQAYWDDNPGFLKRSHSLVPPHSGNLPLWELKGDTMATSEYIRLTPDQQSKTGGLWSRVPITFPWWELQLAYKIHGSGKSIAADGLGMFVIKERGQFGSALGGPTTFTGFAAFLDSYKNGQQTGNFPQISGFVNDGSWSYNHDTDGAEQSIGKCLSGHRNKKENSLLRIRYFEDRLTVKVDPDGTGDFKKTCFEVDGVKLPTGLYVGFTSATGDLTDNHDVVSFKIWQLDSKNDEGAKRHEMKPEVLNLAPKEAVKEESSSGGGWGFFTFILILIIGGGVGFYYYQEREKASAKRFY